MRATTQPAQAAKEQRASGTVSSAISTRYRLVVAVLERSAPGHGHALAERRAVLFANALRIAGH